MNEILNNFDKISKIPRKSHSEEKIRDYMYDWAKERGIYVEKDDYRNIFMRKSASKGYENYPAIALQAHMDMVCEKAEGVVHNFAEDAIKYYIDGDIVSTRGTTTLGGDNGLGVSAIMAIFEDNTLEHPEIEAILTSSEEEDFYGAENFDASKLNCKYLINLDHCNENEILCASAGGVVFTAYKNIDFVDAGEMYVPYEIKISGLKGGHSGEDIHRGRGNSSILLFRFLNYISDLDFYLNSVKGGSYRLAIPRDSKVVVMLNKDQYSTLLEKLNEFNILISEEFQKYKGKIKIEVDPIEIEDKKCMSKEMFSNILDYILVSPVDVQIMSNVFENMVDCSCNLGEIYIEDSKIILISDIRASFNSQKEFILEKLKKLTKAFGLEYEIWGDYFNWKFKSDSKLRELVKKVYAEKGIENIKELSVHAGLECGFFINKKPELDVVSIGPNSWNFHSPKEAFSIKSTNTFYNCLVEILKQAKF